MSDILHGLEIPEPKYNLSIGSGSHGRQTGQMLAALECPHWENPIGFWFTAIHPPWPAPLRRLSSHSTPIEAGLLASIIARGNQPDWADQHLPAMRAKRGKQSAAEGFQTLKGYRQNLLPVCQTRDRRENTCGQARPLTPRGTKVVITGDVMADALPVRTCSWPVRPGDPPGIAAAGYLLATTIAENTDDQALRNILLPCRISRTNPSSSRFTREQRKYWRTCPPSSQDKGPYTLIIITQVPIEPVALFSLNPWAISTSLPSKSQPVFSSPTPVACRKRHIG